MAIANRLKKQAERCAALAKQTHDTEARQRFLKLEQTYLQMAQAEEPADPQVPGPGHSGDLKPAA